MVTIHPQYVVDTAQTRTAVLIPVAEWEQILEALEDLEDIREYDAAKAGSQEAVPFAQAMREIKQENRQ
jgi:PHD/YefM family antitoxin component YafN of YafNO toxin-antitoxin module